MRLGSPVLPDVVAHGLDVLFCGTAAGAASARKRAYYAGPGNAFWPTLFDVGLTPVAMDAHDYARVAEWNLGFTDLAKNVFGSDDVLSKAHFDAERLRSLVLSYRPRIVAFTGKRAAAAFVGHGVSYGQIEECVGTTRLFVLPSPSGAARRHWNAAHWRDLADLRSTLRSAGRVKGAASSIADPILSARSSAG